MIPVTTPGMNDPRKDIRGGRLRLPGQSIHSRGRFYAVAGPGRCRSAAPSRPLELLNARSLVYYLGLELLALFN